MDRRTFLYTGSLLAAASAAPGMAPFIAKGSKLAPGIQLYMVREEMARDAGGTMKQLGAMGYTQLESYGGDKGIFWGLSPIKFQKLATGNGLTLVSAHHNPMSTPEFEQLAAQAAQIGMQYLVCPWLGPQNSIDDFKRFADDFNQRGKICNAHGIRYAYHPHDYPYKPVDGQLPIDVLLAGTDAALVDFQMDVYYTLIEGQDPYQYLAKYKGRFKLMHLRDVLKHRLPKGSADESACDMGEGIINFSRLVHAAQAEGVTYFFVEQSRFYHESPLQSAKKNVNFLKHMKPA
ncbi:sugar phosphate isomerase/epimerase family protein [Mucilaginibacter psychrotolerans]|uniref:Sugar phosphate isomerase/epimerase n=1 Tax=Mucilaginibacter psychrotolerans TaxID=1524096 RepID=A0A4Y8S924_9SPHI|nr:sugar phosphate isomerase/epimerase [Mucilaginibacter psychrotolerans]TFF34856.1 sugar phosphate isomerase/epimerase [Mucilaginibacter psychrotolerans]